VAHVAIVSDSIVVAHCHPERRAVEVAQRSRRRVVAEAQWQIRSHSGRTAVAERGAARSRSSAVAERAVAAAESQKHSGRTTATVQSQNVAQAFITSFFLFTKRAEGNAIPVGTALEYVLE
jgi:hypothetical protein